MEVLKWQNDKNKGLLLATIIKKWWEQKSVPGELYYARIATNLQTRRH
jgi:hypothetical protein